MSEAAFRTFTCSYSHDGARWTFQIKADDFADAERRFAAIKSWGRLDGELMMTIPAPAGFLARWAVALRNWLAKPFP